MSGSIRLAVLIVSILSYARSAPELELSGPGLDLSSAYPETSLRELQPQYEIATKPLLAALMGQFPGQPPGLNSDQRKRLAPVKLRFPLPSEQSGAESVYRGDPLAFYSRSDPPEIVMPVLSLKFLSDVCLAYVWLNRSGHDPSTPSIYMKLLKYNRPDRFPNGRYPPLLEAVGIPENARSDPAIESRFNVTVNHERVFILLHELGHIFYQHDTSGGDQQTKELQADTFALEAMRTLETPPTPIYFTMAANLQLNRSDFPSDTAWRQYLKGLSHPANEQRLQHEADFLRKNAKEFAGGKESTQDYADVLEMANIFESLGKLAAAPESPMVPARSRLVDLSVLNLRKSTNDSKSGVKP